MCDSPLLPARGYAPAGRQVRLARATIPDRNHRFGAIAIAAISQGPDLRRINLRRFAEVELLQSLDARKACAAQPIVNRVLVALFHLHRQQRFQIADMTPLLTHRLFRQGYEVRADATACALTYSTAARWLVSKQPYPDSLDDLFTAAT
jgi:hypothetical protein